MVSQFSFFWTLFVITIVTSGSIYILNKVCSLSFRTLFFESARNKEFVSPETGNQRDLPPEIYAQVLTATNNMKTDLQEATTDRNPGKRDLDIQSPLRESENVKWVLERHLKRKIDPVDHRYLRAAQHLEKKSPMSPTHELDRKVSVLTGFLDQVMLASAQATESKTRVNEAAAEQRAEEKVPTNDQLVNPSPTLRAISSFGDDVSRYRH